MKPLHAAGAALLAWYLLVAPTNKGVVNINAPMRDWKHSESFDNAPDCETARKQIVAVATAVGTTAKPGTVWTKCLSSDDPSLKKN